jgi:hypothetical protein
LNGLHSVISQKIGFFIATAVRTSNHALSDLIKDDAFISQLGVSLKVTVHRADLIPERYRQSGMHQSGIEDSLFRYNFMPLGNIEFGN